MGEKSPKFPSVMMLTVHEFVKRCDSYCSEAGVSRAWLSLRLFADKKRIAEIAETRSDVGAKRLEKAIADLTQLESALAPQVNRGRRQGAAA